jgi:hypothetical protein
MRICVYDVAAIQVHRGITFEGAPVELLLCAGRSRNKDSFNMTDVDRCNIFIFA